MNEEETHECTACCPTCYACIFDMVDQQKEWVGLTKEEVKNEIEFFFRHSYVEDPDRLFLFAQTIQDKLKEKNGL